MKEEGLAGVLIFLGIVMLLTFAFIILRGFWYGARYTIAAVAASARTEVFRVGGTGPQAYGPYTISGIAILDYSHGIPPVPFIGYLDMHNATSTKQLVFYAARACNPNAGDIPCVPPYSATDAYPSVTNGERITATGYIYEDRFLVTSIP